MAVSAGLPIATLAADPVGHFFAVVLGITWARSCTANPTRWVGTVLTQRTRLGEGAAMSGAALSTCFRGFG